MLKKTLTATAIVLASILASSVAFAEGDVGKGVRHDGRELEKGAHHVNHERHNAGKHIHHEAKKHL